MTYHKPIKEVSDQLKASMFAKTHTRHDDLHHRGLSDKGKVKRQAEQDMAAISRRVWR